MSEVKAFSRPQAADSDPIMTVYEAHRKNVFRGRARAPSLARTLSITFVLI